MQVATPDRIYENPNSVYVADFIGDVNIIEGRQRPMAMKALSPSIGPKARRR